MYASKGLGGITGDALGPTAALHEYETLAPVQDRVERYVDGIGLVQGLDVLC